MPELASSTIGVIGSGTDEHDDLARAVGSLLATLGVNLLTGGGGGVMTAVARAYTSAQRSRGISIGIIPCHSLTNRATPKPGYPNPFVELAIRTHLPHSGALGTHDLSRNHINVLSCDAVIALPGAAGTASEVELALAYRTPVAIYAPTPAVVQNFPAAAPRLSRIEEVRAFIETVLTA